MSSRRSAGALRHLRELLRSGTVAGLTDAQLLRRYAESAGEADVAFAALVDRHGPMVWGVCRRMLTDPRDAEDAFQAVFLVLARRAGSVWVDDSLGRWLHAVARKVAARARADARRRRAAEGLANPPSHRDDPASHAHAAELRAAVGEELGRLPSTYRTPIELCHLEGLTYDQAAARLGWPTATLKGRLLRARALLRDRLRRRGWGPPLAVPVELARRVAEARPTAPALTLAKGVLRTMTLYRLAQTAALLTLTAAGARLVSAHGSVPDPPPPPNPPAAAVVEKPAPYSTAISVPLPDSATLHALLRRAAVEADAIARKTPYPGSWSLTSIATAQARAGDADGARETFAFALNEATGVYGKKAYAWNVWRIAHNQALAGLKADAKLSLIRVLDLVPGADGGVSPTTEDLQTSETYAMVVRDLARIGEGDAMGQALDRYRGFVSKLKDKSAAGNGDKLLLLDLASAIAATGDFEAAFKEAERFHLPGGQLGEMSIAAAECCETEKALVFVNEAERRARKSNGLTSHPITMQLIASARSILGDLEGARRLASSIESNSMLEEYLASAMPIAYAGCPGGMYHVAHPQIEAGNFAAARETLRIGFRMLAELEDKKEYTLTFYTIAHGQILAGDAAGALATIQAAPGGRNSALAAQVGLLQSISGAADAAKTTMTLALAAAPTIEQIRNSPSFNAELEQAALLARTGDVSTALETIKALQHEYHRSRGFRDVSSARAAAGDVAGALRIADDETKSPGERRAALEGIGEGVLFRLKLEAALKAGK